MSKFLLKALTMTLCLLVISATKEATAHPTQKPSNSQAVKTEHPIKSAGDISISKNTPEIEALAKEYIAASIVDNDLNNKAGNTSNFSQYGNNTSSKSNLILHLNLGSAFIPAIVISFALLLLFF